MKYTLLKNGTFINNLKISKGDMLIGNNRIMEMSEKIRVPVPNTEIIDVTDRYIMPGLIHYNCPILKNDDENHSAIYIALSQGATFLIDNLRLKKDPFLRNKINKIKETTQPIVTDYGFHLDAVESINYSENDIVDCFVHEGISSFFLRWRNVELLLNHQLDQLLKLAAKYKLLLVVETATAIKCSQSRNSLMYKTYLKRLQEVVYATQLQGCPLLLMDVVSHEEMDAIYSCQGAKQRVYVAVLPHNQLKNDKLKGISIKDIALLHDNPNVILCPPVLSSPNQDPNLFVENGKTPSFISDELGSDKLSLKKLSIICNLYAKRPAKLLGLYPQKGTLNIGADADMVIWNTKEPEMTKTDGANISLLRRDIWGLIMNGELIMDDQPTIPNNISGKYIYRNSIIGKKQLVATL